ncbi:HVA22-like protein f [Musa acuminata AAA Group]|uniref:HVA22-like protein f n=1 Tax=Musa acuminata AAA Group TaxID=214697 RepID=UPI0031D20B55
MLSNSFLPPFLDHGGKKTSNAGISHAFLVSISHLLLKSSNRNLSPSPSITPIASTVKSKMRILVTMAKLVDTLIGPTVMLLYPLYSSMRAIESPSPVDDQQWLTYWVLYSLITLFELSCWRVLQWFPLWPYLKLVFCVWLVLPFFNGAAYIYENHVRRYVRIGTGVGSTYSGLQRRVMQMVSLDARRSIEQFLDGHGAEALEKVVRAAEKEARSRSRK